MENIVNSYSLTCSLFIMHICMSISNSLLFNCLRMANSLRYVLSVDFKRAVGVHINEMDRDDYCKSVDCNWNWLDGQSLLE